MAFRRVVYHRSWFMIVLGLAGIAGIVAFSASFPWEQGIHDDAIYVPILLGPLAVLVLARGLTGSWSKRQLRVDIAAGKLKLPDGSLRDLEALGELTIEKKPWKTQPTRMVVRAIMYDYLLRAANVGYYLFESNYEAETKLRHDAVSAAVLQSRLRRILERPTEQGSAFRSAPDARVEVLDVAGGPEHARAALQALARDHDRSVRDHAATLLGSIS